mmetsp:Transcript_3766/g.12987  ORF Transcript_3766/g.12987 Transcript_3766/m.12987 type:complete len:208 (-) Transcript_3766:1985-2608(-)
MQLRPSVRVERVQRVLLLGRHHGRPESALQRAPRGVLRHGHGPLGAVAVGHVEHERTDDDAGHGGVHRRRGARDSGEFPQQRVRARRHQARELFARPARDADGEEAVPRRLGARDALERRHLQHARRLRPTPGHLPRDGALRVRARAPRTDGVAKRRPRVARVHAVVLAEGAAPVARVPGRQQGVFSVQKEDGDVGGGALSVHPRGV